MVTKSGESIDPLNQSTPLSKSPKLQRVEGGLIFSRANLPIKQDLKIKFIPKDEL